MKQIRKSSEIFNHCQIKTKEKERELAYKKKISFQLIRKKKISKKVKKNLPAQAFQK